MNSVETTLKATTWIVELLGWLNLLGGPLVGGILAFTRNGNGDSSFAVLGLSLAIGGLVYGSAILMVTSYVKWRVLWSRYTAP